MNPDDMRAGRMLAQGDLRLVALALIAQAPRHGYEIIKLVEEKTADWYSPSPGIVYPTLTFLEEAGYVTVSAEGAKKLYTITAEGRAYLEANRDLADVVLDRLAAIGERVNRWRRAARGDREQRRREGRRYRCQVLQGNGGIHGRERRGYGPSHGGRPEVLVQARRGHLTVHVPGPTDFRPLRLQPKLEINRVQLLVVCVAYVNVGA